MPAIHDLATALVDDLPVIGHQGVAQGHGRIVEDHQVEAPLHGRLQHRVESPLRTGQGITGSGCHRAGKRAGLVRGEALIVENEKSHALVQLPAVLRRVQHGQVQGLARIEDLHGEHMALELAGEHTLHG